MLIVQESSSLLSSSLLSALQAFRLASPMLPIGGFSYSQGLECAIDLGWIKNEAGVKSWIESLLAANIRGFELPMLYATCRALELEDFAQVRELNTLYLASRETAELRAETLQMGASLWKVLQDLPEAAQTMAPWRNELGQATVKLGLPLAWALASKAWGIAAEPAVIAFAWAWCENQVAAAMKALPMGQQAGQRVFSALAPGIAEAAKAAATLSATPEQWSNFAPGFAIACSLHETQYSRLFRS